MSLDPVTLLSYQPTGPAHMWDVSLQAHTALRWELPWSFLHVFLAGKKRKKTNKKRSTENPSGQTTTVKFSNHGSVLTAWPVPKCTADSNGKSMSVWFRLGRNPGAMLGYWGALTSLHIDFSPFSVQCITWRVSLNVYFTAVLTGVI